MTKLLLIIARNSLNVKVIMYEGQGKPSQYEGISLSIIISNNEVNLSINNKIIQKIAKISKN